MDVILHIGAHRTGTTTFQHYVRDHRDALTLQDVGFWGPQRTRTSIFPGLFRDARLAQTVKTAQRASGRIAMHAEQVEAKGIKQLLVSDENIMGTPRHNLRSCTLYPAVGERLARIGAAFRGRVTRVVMSVRSQDHWWASAAAMTVGRGHPVPSAVRREAIACNTRSWRDVITDVSCALPGAEISVLPFEQHMGRPQNILLHATGGAVPRDQTGRWLNRSPDLAALRRVMKEQGGEPNAIPKGHGRWMPFTTEQSAQLREAYVDDMHWLTAGADGLATFITDPTRKTTGSNLHAGVLTEGIGHDLGQEKLARSG